MTCLTRRAVLGTALVALAPTVGAQPAPAVQITRPWTRAAGQGGTGAGYFTLRSAAGDRLVSASADIARSVELHTHINDNGVMRMRPVPAIDLPAGQEVTLRPGGLHLMLIGLTAPLVVGQRVPITLVFERAGAMPVELTVEAAGARGPGSAHSH